jgi:Fe2+ transport system protein FeoA
MSLTTSYVSLADLPKGSRAEVVAFHDTPLSLRLMQFGFTPGTALKVDCHAPLGCPVCISLDGDYHLSLRKSEAETIEVRLV